MPKFSVLLEGNNFPIKFVGEGTRLMGFVTTRSVFANDSDDAERSAIESVTNDVSLAEVLDNASDASPKVFVLEIKKLPWWRRLGGQGYSFYPMEEDEN